MAGIISASMPLIVAEDPATGARAYTNLNEGAGLLFKGSGFYITDYGKDGKKDQRASKPAEGGKSESKAEGKSESKSDATPAAKPAEPKKSSE